MSAGTEQSGSPGSRRVFLRTAAVTTGASLLAPRAESQSSLAVQPAAFDVSADGALIWVAGDQGVDLAVEISADEAFSAPMRVPVTGLNADNDHVGAVRVEGLQPDRLWHFRIVGAKSGAAVSRAGRFRTAPQAPRPFTFAWSADTDERYQPFRLFDAIGERDPEFFLHLGDTIYADLPRSQFRPSLSHYRYKHRVNRRDTHMQRFLLRHPTYAIWDDHETDNDCHGGHPSMPQARQVFREYWPCRSVAGDGLYRRFSWAGVDFFILDTRSYRSPPAPEEGREKTMLGNEQKRWLLDALRASTSPFKFVITSVPFQGGGNDTWFSYRAERDETAAFIRGNSIGGVVFLTGDYHLARDWTNPKAAFREFMAGPIGSFAHYQNTPSARDRYDKVGTFHYGDGANFGLVQVDPAARVARVSFVDQSGKVMHAIEFGA